MNKKLHPLAVVAILVGLIGILAFLFKSLLAATACVVSILLAASFFWGLGQLEAWYRRRRAVAGKLKNSLELQRLLKPDWVFYEQHLGREIPDAIRRLYQDKEFIARECFPFPGKENAWAITSFVPISRGELLEFEAEPGLPSHPIAPIATTDLGDPIYLEPGSDRSNSVYVWEHELQEPVKPADSPEEFLNKLERSLYG